MDSLVTAAARALRAGDPLGALKRVALRDDPPALALRGVAMAQLGELTQARRLLRRAARGFGPAEDLERARCLTAEAEVALAARDLGWPGKALDEARRTFTRRGDRENALHAGLMLIRRRLLMGEVDAAERLLSALDLRGGSHLSAANGALAAFEIAVRRGQTGPARAAPEIRIDGVLDHVGRVALEEGTQRRRQLIERKLDHMLEQEFAQHLQWLEERSQGKLAHGPFSGSSSKCRSRIFISAADEVGGE